MRGSRTLQSTLVFPVPWFIVEGFNRMQPMDATGKLSKRLSRFAAV